MLKGIVFISTFILGLASGAVGLIFFQAQNTASFEGWTANTDIILENGSIINKDTTLVRNPKVMCQLHKNPAGYANLGLFFSVDSSLYGNFERSAHSNGEQIVLKAKDI